LTQRIPGATFKSSPSVLSQTSVRKGSLCFACKQITETKYRVNPGTLSLVALEV
jgi:hypothetical protein